MGKWVRYFGNDTCEVEEKERISKSKCIGYEWGGVQHHNWSLVWGNESGPWCLKGQIKTSKPILLLFLT